MCCVKLILNHWSDVQSDVTNDRILHTGYFFLYVCRFSIGPIGFTDQTGEGPMKLSSISCYGPMKYTLSYRWNKIIVRQTDIYCITIYHQHSTDECFWMAEWLLNPIFVANHLPNSLHVNVQSLTHTFRAIIIPATYRAARYGGSQTSVHSVTHIFRTIIMPVSYRAARYMYGGSQTSVHSVTHIFRATIIPAYNIKQQVMEGVKHRFIQWPIDLVLRLF